jgi:serine/threonine-protein kinase
VTDAPSEHAGEGTWTRLRRRRVAQRGLAYVAVAWTLLQGLEYLVETFHWPESLRQLATLALVGGFPIALVLLWYHGDRGRRAVTASEVALLLALLLPLGGGLYWWGARHGTTAGSVNSVERSVATPPPAQPVVDRSIAVLPFVNMSPDPAQEYFSDGMAEQVLDQLAKVPDLRVISRTSSFSFKGKDLDVATIGQRLNVSHVLEGSVRKSGSRVRITAQLVRTADSSQMWSATYDRELTDVFAIQDEIAGAVTQELKAALLSGAGAAPDGGAPRSTRSRVDPQAYELYLRGRYAMRSWSGDSLAQAEELFRLVVEREPDFGEAWASLAEIAVLRHEIHQERERESAYAWATEAARRALATQPAPAEGHAALSHILWHERRWQLAEEEARRAVGLNSSSAIGYEWLGMALTALGRLQEADVAFRRALALDPLSQTYYANSAMTLVSLGRYADAESLMERAAQLGEPGFTPFLWWTGVDVLLRVGRLDQAERWVERCAAIGPKARLLVQLLRARLVSARGDEASARRLVAEVAAQIPRGGGMEVFVSGAGFMVGDVDLALEWLERSPASADLLATARFQPEIQRVIGHPRMQAMLRETGLEGLPATGPGTPAAK